MSPASASCPSCGAPVLFTVENSVVTVCKSCHSIVARGDQKLEDLGKVSHLTDTGAVLVLGMEGKYEGKRFMLTGRTQLKHAAGGVWDEWYAAFNDGRWGWLAEAQGKYYFTFEQMAPVEGAPSFDALEVGKPVAGLKSKVQLLVQEKGEAEAIAAEGEIPFRLTPGERSRYVDLSGKGAGFATLDYSVAPQVFFIGKRVTLDEIGIKSPKKIETTRVVGAKTLSCPHCGGQLELRAPDKTERVACPYCNSLLDASQGDLRFLEALKQPKSSPIIPLGKRGTIKGIEWQHIGYVVRAVNYEGTKYPWDEYLLYNPQHGFRWLVQSDGHWSFGEPIDVAEVSTSVNAKYAVYDKKSYRLYQDGHPFVEGVWGEFYWQVKKGETVRSADYINPPHMLSCEVSQGKSEEVNWSLLTWLPPKEVQQAFGLEKMPRTEGVAPNQPFPHKRVYFWWKIFAAIVVLASIVLAAKSPERVVFESDFTLDSQLNQEAAQVFFTDPFPVSGGQNLEVTARAPVANSWIYVQGDFVDDGSGLVQSFDLPIEYYNGVDGGESWSEGSPERQDYYSALPAGNYALRLEVQRGNFAQPMVLHVRVRQGVSRTAHFFLVWLFISLIPIWTGIRQLSWDKKRWQNSDYSPYNQG